MYTEINSCDTNSNTNILYKHSWENVRRYLSVKFSSGGELSQELMKVIFLSLDCSALHLRRYFIVTFHAWKSLLRQTFFSVYSNTLY